MKNSKILYILFPFLLFNACDLKAKFAIVQNNMSDTIAVVPWDDKELGLITDSMVFNNRIYMPLLINPQGNHVIAIPNGSFIKEPDSAKLDLYIFNLDSLSHFQKLNMKNGILMHCLARKIEIQVNRIKKPLDTIFIR